MTPRSLFLALPALLLAACSGAAPSISYKPLNKMVKATGEEVSVDLSAPNAIDTLGNWVVNDVPSAAVMTCTQNTALCDDAVVLLKSYRIPYTIESISAESDKIVLIYDRITETPCNERTYGCPQALNAFNMVDDLRKVVRPNPVDYPTADRFLNGAGKTE
jgi:hypothetical protein